MRQSVRLGRVAGIPVGMHWSVIVVVALIAAVLGNDVLPAMVPGEPAVAYWTVAVVGALLFIAALLAHEFSHAFVARRAGVEVRSITLWALGGIAELAGDPPTARADLKIAVAGPATSLLAAVVFGGTAFALGAAGAPGIAIAALIWLAFMNGLLAVFNLLPGAPLDGGRILRALLWMRHGDRARAARTAAGAGRFVGAGLIGLGLAELLFWQDPGGLWLMLIGLFLAVAANAEAAAESAGGALGDLRVADVMTPDPAIGAGWISVSDFIDSVAVRSSQTVFPVIGFDGGLIGIVDLGRLARVPATDRPTLLLQQLALPVPPSYLARPDAPARTLLTRPPLAGELLALVTDQGRIIGMVTAGNLNQMIRREQLRERPLHQAPA